MPPKPPKKSRAIKTRENLMAALERLLREREFETISVQDIAKEAGVAVGSVYSHFKDKTAFLAALLEMWRSNVETQLELSEAQDLTALFQAYGSLSEALVDVTRQAHQQVVENGHVLRAVHTYTRLHPDEGGDDWNALVARSFAPFSALFDVFADEIATKDRTQATAMLGYIFNTIFVRKALIPQDTLLESLKLEDDVLIEQVAAMIHAYLTKASTKASTS